MRRSFRPSSSVADLWAVGVALQIALLLAAMMRTIKEIAIAETMTRSLANTEDKES